MRKRLCFILGLALALSILAPPQALTIAKAAAPTPHAKTTASFRLATGKAVVYYKLAKRGAAKLQVLNPKGVMIRTIQGKTVDKGKLATISWNGRDKSGNYVKAGTYKLRLHAGGAYLTRSVKAVADRQTFTAASLLSANLRPMDALSVAFRLAKKYDVQLQVVNAAGRQVYKRDYRDAAANRTYTASWNLKSGGGIVPDGDYRVNLISGNAKKTLAFKLESGVPVQSVALDRSSAQLNRGESIVLAATITPGDATDKSVVWSSSNPAVAEVTNAGLVTAKKPGSAVITAAAGGKAATCGVTVTPVLAVGAATVRLGDSAADIIQRFGQPDRIDPGQYGYDYYIYNSDYARFLMIGVAGGKVVSYYTDAVQFDCMGLTGNSGASDISAAIFEDKALAKTITYTYDNTVITFFMDTLGAGNLLGVEVRPQGAASGKSPEVLRAMEKQVFDSTHAFRVKQGQSPLEWSELAQQSALKHSEDMSANNYFSHTGLDGRSSSKRMTDEGITWSSCGENIAAGYTSALHFTGGWINSSGHRSNMLSAGFTHLGVGIANGTSASNYSQYGTQNFFSVR